MKKIFQKSLLLIVLIPGSLAFMLLLYYQYGTHDVNIFFSGVFAYIFLNDIVKYFRTRWLRYQEEKQMNEVPSV